MIEASSVSMANFNAISSLLKQVLDFIFGVVGNYGWSVIIFTLLIRLLVLPLDIKSKQSMRKTQVLQPKLQAIQKKYANDKEKLNKKTQELYKAEGINPLAGCLPMLISMPVLMCMFTAMRVMANEQIVQMLLNLKDGIEPVFQNWFWVKNVFQPDSFMASIIPMFGDPLSQIQGVNGSAILTAENVAMAKNFVQSAEYSAIAAQFGASADTLRYTAKLLMWDIKIPLEFNGLFILPILAAATSLLSSKLLNAGQKPQPAAQGDQAQQTNKMMTMMMPLMSLFFCATSNAAFSIYWVFVNIIQIVQQYLMNVYFERKDAQESGEIVQAK